ncbi:hypothetical protein [Streptomyces sp. ACT015]|uniref:hypothetical protein n=1 Tax=Streptomyces sp. ACT015 TaxID=3134807 RepID=UPI003D184512
MDSRPLGPIPLPAAARPDDCRPWDGDRARRWTGALPSPLLTVPVRFRVLLPLVLFCVIVASLLAVLGSLPPLPAALLGLLPVLLAARPEAVRFTAPALVVAVGVSTSTLSWPLLTGAALFAVALVAAAGPRLAARAGQREAALAAAGGVTAALPAPAVPVKRGRFLAVAGTLTVLAGGGLLLVAPYGDLPEDRDSAAVLGFLVVGLGLTVLGSGYLGRRRSVALRAHPAPVLGVLVREGRHGDTDVFAADDTDARRPLFRVALTEAYDEESHADDEDDEEGAGDDGGRREDEDGLDLLVPAPVREAVLYGAPWDGAEIVVVSAAVDAEDTDAPPVVLWSSGPVRPRSEPAVRAGLLAMERDAGLRKAQEARSRAAAERFAAERTATGQAPVRGWRAGWRDRSLVAVATVVGLYLFADGGPLWRYGCGTAVGVGCALLLPRLAAWRITADDAGLWVSGLRGPRFVGWDDARVALDEDGDLVVGSAQSSFPGWTLPATRGRSRSPERDARRADRTARTAAELTALIDHPGLRPSAPSTARERGRPLWPLALAAAVLWTAALVLLP